MLSASEASLSRIRPEILLFAQNNSGVGLATTVFILIVKREHLLSTLVVYLD